MGVPTRPRRHPNVVQPHDTGTGADCEIVDARTRVRGSRAQRPLLTSLADHEHGCRALHGDAPPTGGLTASGSAVSRGKRHPTVPGRPGVRHLTTSRAKERGVKTRWRNAHYVTENLKDRSSNRASCASITATASTT
jgi:hypothetical protein